MIRFIYRSPNNAAKEYLLSQNETLKNISTTNSNAPIFGDINVDTSAYLSLTCRYLGSLATHRMQQWLTTTCFINIKHGTLNPIITSFDTLYFTIGTIASVIIDYTIFLQFQTNLVCNVISFLKKYMFHCCFIYTLVQTTYL